MHLGVIEDCTAVRAVVNFKRDALLFKLRDERHKARELLQGKCLAILATICHGKMREDALRDKPRAAARFCHNAYGLFVALNVLKIESEAAHAGINLDVNLHLNAAFYGVFGERRAVFCRIRALRNVVFGKHVCGFRRGIAQHEQRQLDARTTHLQGFLNVGKRQPVCAEGFVFLCHAHRAVPVGIRLNHTADHRPVADIAANFLKIVRRRVEVDLRPCSFL